MNICISMRSPNLPAVATSGNVAASSNHICVYIPVYIHSYIHMHM